MQEEPDYSTYSLSDLRDVRRRIDAERFPERVAQIDRELASRPEEAKKELLENRRQIRAKTPTKQTVAFALIAFGAISLALVLDHVRGSNAFALVAALALFFYGTMIVAGVCILKRLRIGWLMGLVITALQVPIFQIGRLGYSVGFFPTSELRLWPPLEISFSMSQVMTIFWLNSSRPFQFGANISAFVLCNAVAYHYFQQRDAIQRLKSSQARNARREDLEPSQEPRETQ